jgi:hypothetical protein
LLQRFRDLALPPTFNNAASLYAALFVKNWWI